MNTAGEGCTDRPVIFVDGRVISPWDFLFQSRKAWWSGLSGWRHWHSLSYTSDTESNCLGCQEEGDAT